MYIKTNIISIYQSLVIQNYFMINATFHASFLCMAMFMSTV